MSTGSVGLILVGAGSSRRMGGLDKVWADLSGRPVLQHSLERFCPAVAAVVLVVRADHLARADALVSRFPGVQAVAGGEERQDSVWRGLSALPPVEIIAVHDAARPLAPARLLTDGIQALDQARGALPAIEVTDTIKSVDGRGRVKRTIDRAGVRAVQTPQVFAADVLRHAHALARTAAMPATDDASLLENCGYPVRVFPGAAENIKITTDLDLRLARLLLESGWTA